MNIFSPGNDGQGLTDPSACVAAARGRTFGGESGANDPARSWNRKVDEAT